MRKLAVVLFSVLSGVSLLLGGCAGSYQARSVDLGDLKGTLLVNPDILKPGGEDQALYRYQNPQVNLADYNQVLIDPVIISKQAELSENELQNYQTLANNFYVYLDQNISKYLSVVKAPGPGTLRIQVAIIDADNSKPVRTILSFTPIGIGLNLIKYTATGKQTAVGEITAEMKVTDAMTGQLIGAAVDRRVGGKSFKDIYETWSNADAAVKFWAEKMAYVVCQTKNLPGCVKPEN